MFGWPGYRKRLIPLNDENAAIFENMLEERRSMTFN